jgi:hypothetical protein
LRVIRPTPAIVTQLAARRLPRWVIVLLGLFYVVPGFLGRDPWRNEDLAAFGVMFHLAQAPWEQWLSPTLLGEAPARAGWLPYWLGAVAIQALPFLPADLAAKIPFAALLGLTLASTWYAVFHLARAPGAQPVSFAFGGEAHPIDYARATADAALLALIATLGLAMLAHETSVDAARLAFVAMGFHAGARCLSPHARHPWKTLTLWWASAYGLALSGAPGFALLVGLWPLAALGGRQWQRRAEAPPAPVPAPPRWLLLMGLAGAVSAAAAVYLWGWPGGWWRDISLLHWGRYEAWRSLGRLLAWFTWPIGLLAAWAVWTWRRQWLSSHWLLPTSWVALVLLATLWHRGSDRTLLLALPALAALAAFALPTLRRSVTALIDWFALLFFTGGAIIIWTIWVAMMTGVPAKPAANVAKLAPHFEPVFYWSAWLPALVATIAWLGVMAWRMGRHRPALWKSLVLSASGSTLCWILLMTLWLPLLNHGMGQRPMSQRVAAAVPAGDCVAVFGLSQAQIAGLQYHGGLRVVRAPSAAAADCNRLVVDTEDYVHLAGVMPLDGWRLMTRIPRLRDNRDTWMMFERARP